MSYLPEDTFVSLKDLKRFVSNHGRALRKGISKQQFCVIHQVPVEVFEDLDKTGLDSTRLQYNYDKNDLIIKFMPSLEHDAAHLLFIKAIETQVIQMDLKHNKLYPTGTTTYKGKACGKQGDSGLKPIPERRKKTDWPTLVVECGVSENLRELRGDASWWLTNSNGDVRIAILVLINLESRSLMIEKWQLVAPSSEPTEPSTRVCSRHGSAKPMMTAHVEVFWDIPRKNVVGSDQLIIEFEDLLLRSPVPPEEDIVFSREDLQNLTTDILSGSE